MATKKKFYVVKQGRTKGIFFTWEDCKKQVDGYPKASFKGFALMEEALEWLYCGSSRAKKEAYKKRLEADKPVSIEEFAPNFIAYTDGSCLKNPNGPGGWATVITDTETGEITELCDGCPSTTNNRMELQAAIAAMSFPKEPSKIALYTDSKYLKNAFTEGWLVNWKKRGWIKSDGEPVLNQDLWEQLDELYQKHEVVFYWVKGHVGIQQNERCDALARREAIKHKPKNYSLSS